MKKYKNLIPILLICFMALGIYSSYTGAAEKQEKISENLAKAREHREKGVIQDALTYYEAAMELENNFDIEYEAGQMLEEAELYEEAEKWGEHLIEKFPKKAEGYSFLLAQYIAEEDYESCFQLNDKAVNNKCVNKNFEELMTRIDYLYEYEYEKYEDVLTFSAGMCAGMVEGKWKLLNDNGSSEASGFLEAGLYNGEVFPVKQEDGWQYVTPDGNKKIDISKLENCQELGVLIGDVFKAKCNGRYGYYNKDIEEIVGGFEAASSMNEGIAAVNSKGKWKLLDGEGKQIGKEYKEIVINVRDIAYQSERIWVSDDGESYYMIDSAGERIGGESVDNSRGFTVTEGMAAVERNGKWGFMDYQGDMVIEPQYEDARSFCNGYAAVKQGGRWGFINEQGTMVIEPQFSETKDFSNGNVFVKRGESWELLKLYRYNYE